MKSNALRLTLTAVFALATSAVASADTLTIAQNFDPQTLWPNGSTASDNLNAGAAIVEPLFYFDPRDDALKPLLATSYKLESPLSVRVDLRDAVKFTNGEPMNADAVVHSIKVFIDKTQAPGYAGVAAAIASVEKVEDLSVRIILKYPYPALELMLSQIFVTPPVYWAQVGLEGYGQKPVGTGPFILGQWNRDDKLVMTRNDAYWGAPLAGVDEIIWKPVPNDISRAAGLVTGEYDVAVNLAVNSFMDLEGKPGVKGVSLPSYRVFGIFLYHTADGKNPLDDKRVRKALNYAIDKQAIIDSLFFGKALPLKGQVLRETQIGFNANIVDYPYDPAKAKLLLNEAGYKSGLKIGFRYPSGRYAQDREVSEAIAGMLSDVGIKTEMMMLEPGEFLRQMRAKELQPMGYMGLAPQNDPDFFLSLFHSSWPWAPTKNPAFDTLIEAGRQEIDTAKRAAIYKELMALMYEEVPVVFLYNAMDFHGVTNRLKNFAVRGDGRIFLYGIALER